MAQVKALFLRVSTVSPEDIAMFSEALISCKTALICLNVKENDILNEIIFWPFQKSEQIYSILVPVNKSEISHCETSSSLWTSS